MNMQPTLCSSFVLSATNDATVYFLLLLAILKSNVSLKDRAVYVVVDFYGRINSFPASLRWTVHLR
jgi:hypothetical protein